jgi:ribokinase
VTGSVVVVGSANVDLVVHVPRHPGAGETILGGDLRRSAGGKGANQAVAAARAGGAETVFLGALGRDDAADLLLASLESAGVDCRAVQRVQGASGTALISVSDDGENTIIVAPGANSKVAIDEAARTTIGGADVVLAQLEIPLSAVVEAARSRRDGAPFVLNAAPSQPLPSELWQEVDVLVVNEHEARDLAGLPESADAKQLARALLQQVAAVLVTGGARGCVVARRGEDAAHVPAPTVTAVDTTGAGDTFCGVLAAALVEGQDLLHAARVASVAAGLAVTRRGAQEAVPSRVEVAQLALDGSAAERP